MRRRGVGSFASEAPCHPENKHTRFWRWLRSWKRDVTLVDTTPRHIWTAWSNSSDSASFPGRVREFLCEGGGMLQQVPRTPSSSPLCFQMEESSSSFLCLSRWERKVPLSHRGHGGEEGRPSTASAVVFGSLPPAKIKPWTWLN